MKYAKQVNGTVRKYGVLPLTFENILNFRKADIQTINNKGFYEVIEPVITQYQRLIPLEVGDFSNSVWTHRIYDFTQQEIDDFDQAQLDSDSSAEKYSTRISDGQTQYKRFVDKIIRDKDNSVITGGQALNVILNFNEGMQYLKDGFQEATKNVVQAIAPANQYEIDLQTLIINKLTDYINDNPL